jgi:predicted SAM-dependent methyltransferase
VVDHTDQQSLIEKYQAYGVDTSSIEPVDYITTDLATLPVEEHSFDLIVASHVIEHTTDLIKFLSDCNKLLTDDGELALLIPDKRYCFDTFRPVTSPGAVVTAHHNQHARHIGGLLDHYSYFTLNSGAMAWGVNDKLSHNTIHTVEQCKSVLEKGLSTDEYLDAHEWVFTPSSFLLLVQELSAYHLTELNIDQFHDTIGFEFFATLSRTALPREEDKLALLKKVRHEEIMSSPLAKALMEAAELLDLDGSDLDQLAEGIVLRLRQLLSQEVQAPNSIKGTSHQLAKRWRSLARRVFSA